MSIENPYTLLVALLVLSLGAVGCLYLIVHSLRKMRGKDAAPSPSRARKASWSQRLMNWMSEPVSASSTGSKSSADQEPTDVVPRRPEPIATFPGAEVEVMRVLRRGAMGKLVVEVDGREYKKLVEIQDGAAGRRVLLAIQELIDFAGEYGRRPMPEMQRLAGPDQKPVEQDRALVAKQEAFLAQLQESPVNEQVEETKPSLVGYWRRGLSRTERRAAAKAAEEAPKSFIDEIEEMLQLRLAGRADMDSHSVHFKSTLMGELRIEVDGGFYEAIEDVPYPEVRSLLKATITAWELG